MTNTNDLPCKRPKIDSNQEIIVENTELPSEVWANILDYLPFSDVIQCSVVSCNMLRDVLPRVTQLSIFRKEELRIAFARRFRGGNVTQIDVYCLILCIDHDQEEQFSLCQYTASRIVPFICEFTKLDAVGLDVDAEGIPLGTYFRDTFVQEDSVEIVRSLVRSICGAYQTGAISQEARLYGPAFQAGAFICYKAEACNLCKMYCQSFPLEQAVNARATCISVRERLNTIASRPGGAECLASKTLALELLRSNYEVPFMLETAPNEYITKTAKVFSKAVMEELEILCKDYFNAKSLEKSDVIEALGSDEDDGDIWLVGKYYEKLLEFDFPVSNSDLNVVDESKLLSDVHYHM
eukprot:CAMPEP_0194213440 /NCGR_PEP_ID=MMETSP0156-20130528/14045_1 /TAXON_ID=33649 /ORGANISM="Thalassionema nitzschioides, Strain L26-B" /LENGTH=351 /DNA_ID=CAMNT_0038941467 /DNA_START=28 /DNA_END=1083 /DNA_ORIENTATION=+